MACDEGTCTDPDHHEPTVKIRQWRGLAQKLAALRSGTKPVAVAYHRDAARRVLSRFFAIVCGLICLPLIRVAAANDVPPSARNSASSAIVFWRAKRHNLVLM